MNIRFLILGHIELLQLITDAFKGFTFIIYAYLFLVLLKKGIPYVKIVLWVHLLILIFAFLHHPSSPVASQVSKIKKVVLSVDAKGDQGRLANEDIYIEQGMSNRFRLSGPFAYSIIFSYFAITSFLISFFLFIKTKKRFYLLMLALLLIAAFLSQTRSLILAFIFVIVGYLFLQKEVTWQYKLNLFFLSIISIFLLIIALSTISINSRVTNSAGSHGSSDNRPILWATGVLAVLEHPFGVSDQQYQKVKQYMYRKYGGGRSVLHLTSHNGLINVGFHYTFFGYILFLSFYIFLFKTILPMPYNYKLFFSLSLIAYIIHTSFHNNFILYSDYAFLMVIVLLGFESSQYNKLNSRK